MFSIKFHWKLLNLYLQWPSPMDPVRYHLFPLCLQHCWESPWVYHLCLRDQPPEWESRHPLHWSTCTVKNQIFRNIGIKDWKGLAAMMTLVQSVGVTPEDHTGEKAHKRDALWLWNPGWAINILSANQGYQWLHEEELCPEKLKKTNKPKNHWN